MFLQPLITFAKNKALAGSRKSIESLMSQCQDPGMTDYVTRSEWGARAPKSREELKTPVALIVLKYVTDVGPCKSKEECIKAVQELQAKHMDNRGMPDIGYNFLIGSDGNIYEGRGWQTKTEPYPLKDERYRDLNSRSIDVVFIGRWVEKPPLSDMMSAVADLCIIGEKKKFLDSEWDVFEPSRLRKPIIKHKEGILVTSKRDKYANLEIFREYDKHSKVIV